MAKSKYTEDLPARVQEMAENGYTDKEIYETIGISHETFYKWLKKFPEFSDALKKGKIVPDQKVEQTLYKSALGHEYTKITKEFDKEGNEIRRKEEVVRVEPNTTAMIFWLKNRKPKEWRDKKDLEHSGEVVYKVIPAPEVKGD